MTQETVRYRNFNIHFPGAGFNKVKQAIIGKRIASIQQDDDFKATVTLDDGTLLQVEGNEGGCECANGDWPISNLLANMTRPKGRIMNAWIDNQITVDDHFMEIGGPITVFIMVEGEEYPLVEFTGYDNGWYGHGFYCRVSQIIPPESGHGK